MSPDSKPASAEYDAFVSHASEDKSEVVRPLAEELDALGLDVWYDEFELNIGDSIRRKIDRGLSDCDYGIVILSDGFFAKEWPQRELDALTSREIVDEGKMILPVWHGVDADTVRDYSPTLVDKYAISINSDNIVDVAGKLYQEIEDSGESSSPDYDAGTTERVRERRGSSSDLSVYSKDAVARLISCGIDELVSDTRLDRERVLDRTDDDESERILPTLPDSFDALDDSVSSDIANLFPRLDEKLQNYNDLRSEYLHHRSDLRETILNRFPGDLSNERQKMLIEMTQRAYPDRISEEQAARLLSGHSEALIKAAFGAPHPHSWDSGSRGWIVSNWTPVREGIISLQGDPDFCNQFEQLTALVDDLDNLGEDLLECLSAKRTELKSSHDLLETELDQKRKS